MKKNIRFKLSKFPKVPHLLRQDPKKDIAATHIEVDLARLYHHYYLDTRGRTPPNPDPAHFDYLADLLADDEFRVAGDGFGKDNDEHRKAASNALGRAFCRWFLYEHLNITYFAHIKKVLKKNPSAFGGITIKKELPGDGPDYFCAEDTTKICLAEAKGRISSISFSGVSFAKWRKQFETVVIRDRIGIAKSVKGYIVATRFATEAKPSTFSTIYAEDPASPGEEDLEETANLGSSIIGLHYSEIAEKLNQPILASALASGVSVPSDIRFPATVWKFRPDLISNRPDLANKRFVGGYYITSDGYEPIILVNGQIQYRSQHPFRLDIARGTFLGVEEEVFKKMCAIVRGSDSSRVELHPLADTPGIYSAISLLRDGSIVGPVDFFEPSEFSVY